MRIAARPPSARISGASSSRPISERISITSARPRAAAITSRSATAMTTTRQPAGHPERRSPRRELAFASPKRRRCAPRPRRSMRQAARGRRHCAECLFAQQCKVGRTNAHACSNSRLRACSEHLALELLDALAEVFLRQRLDLRHPACAAFCRPSAARLDAIDQVAHFLSSRWRRDAVFGVERDLARGGSSVSRSPRPSSRSPGRHTGSPCRSSACRAANRLDQAAAGAQEALLVGVEDRDQRDLGMSSPSRSRLMPTSTSNAPRRRSQDLHALDGVDVAVQVAHLTPLSVGSRSGLGHALGQRRHEHALAHP